MGWFTGARKAAGRSDVGSRSGPATAVVRVPPRGAVMTLTNGERLPVVLGQDEIPDRWADLAALIVAASGEPGDDAGYVALTGLFRTLPVAWYDVLSEPTRQQAMGDAPPELGWFRARSIDEGVKDASDYEIVKVASMLATPGTLASIRGSL